MKMRARLVLALWAFALIGPAAHAESDPANKAEAECRAKYDEKSCRAPYGLYPESWNFQCAGGLLAKDIVAKAKDRCRRQYDPQKCLPIGLSEAEWGRACDRGFGGRSPAAYLVEKENEFVLAHPSDKASVRLAYIFLGTTKGDRSPEVRRKRRELQARLRAAEEVHARYGAALSQSQWMVQPLAIGVGVGSEADYRKWMSRFDLAEGASGDSGPGAPGVVPAGGTFVARPDDRPLRPAYSMRGADAGLDDPAKTKASLLDKVRSLSGSYDRRIIAVMEEAVRAVPVDEGRPPRTDLVALEDARTAVETVIKNKPVFVLDKDLRGYGLTRAARGPKGNLVQYPDGTFQQMVSFRPVDRGSSEEYPDERLAGVFLHEVAGHVALDISGGGANSYVDETNAFRIEYRYFSNRDQDIAEQLSAAQRDLEKSRGTLPPAEVRKREEEVTALMRRREKLLGKWREDLEEYQEHPDLFEDERISDYYGEGQEIKPGELTISQQRVKLLKEKVAALESGNLSEQARADLLLRQLKVDEAADRESRDRERRWRAAKKMECEALLKEDAEALRIRGRSEELRRRQASAGLTPADNDAIEAEFGELADAYLKNEKKYAACKIRAD